ncbi:MAG: ARPP-1 family domain-containing protein [Planctomycetota bacterium]
MHRCALLAGMVLFAACGSSPEAATKAVARIDDNHYLGAGVTAENLTVWPIYADKALDIGEFLTLEEAHAKELAEVREVGRQTVQQESQGVQQEGQVLQTGATVGRLVIENKGDLPILVVAGTLVKGGKQDRQIGQDFVVQARSETFVDAFWDKVATMNSARSIIEGTSLHNASFHADPRFREVEERLRKRVTAHFAGLEKRPVGFAYAINGKPVTVRTFAHERICADQLNGFVNTMCMEAQVAGEEAKAPAREASAEDVVALVRAIDAAKEELKETSAANTNGYRKTDLGYGATCYFELEGKRRVALTRDWTSK